MTKLLLIMLGALILETIGVIYMSSGLKRLPSLESYTPGAILRLVAHAFRNSGVLLGVFFQALFFFLLLYLLSQADVTFVWPLTALSFAFTALAAKIYLREEVSAVRWLGVALIISGAALITWTEAAKVEDSSPQPQPLRATSP